MEIQIKFMLSFAELTFSSKASVTTKRLETTAVKSLNIKLTFKFNQNLHIDDDPSCPRITYLQRLWQKC